ncbi:MAG: hypothetical protein F2527_04670 [Actinobacteria bacterium]|jgi:hypothetical protein|nr:hypothetical protein [Actinomycetota bacterium]MSZ37491.1 hypothetical protein [Actinomycetota bacterium]MTA10176.1 hypothetical protein [Actinomycetota bacterium]
MESTLIDCGTCVMHETAVCADCVVTFLYRDEEPDSGSDSQTGAIVFDIAEIRAMRALAEAGLVPTLRHRESG